MTRITDVLPASLRCPAVSQIFAGQNARPGVPYATIMPEHVSVSTARREFLKFLAASPYVAALGGVATYLERSAFAQSAQQPSDVIASPAEALDVLDFEEAAHRKVPPGHWAFMTSGVDDDGTLRANSEAYKHIQLRPRRLRDASNIDTRISLFSAEFPSPIFLCPVSGHKAFYFPGAADGDHRARRRRAALAADGDGDVGRAGVARASAGWAPGGGGRSRTVGVGGAHGQASQVRRNEVRASTSRLARAAGSAGRGSRRISATQGSCGSASKWVPATNIMAVQANAPRGVPTL